jgi:Family of unknown function (DUF6644)
MMLYWRTSLTIVCVIAALLFALSGARVASWEAAQPVFEWMETTPFGYIGKTWGAAFAVIEAFHLLAMALLGGAVLVSDAQLLGIAFRDQPVAAVQRQAHKMFCYALALMVFTGVFMACGVAMKIYYLDVFWYKMLSLAAGITFVFLIKQPLLKGNQPVDVWTGRVVATASLMIWFTVAATGRWIGFSG